MAQDALNNGGIEGAKDFLDSTRNYERFSANLQAYLDKKYGGGLDEANDKFDKASADADRKLAYGKDEASQGTGLGTSDRINDVNNEIPGVENTVSPTVATDKDKIDKALNDNLTNNGGVVPLDSINPYGGRIISEVNKEMSFPTSQKEVEERMRAATDRWKTRNISDK